MTMLSVKECELPEDRTEAEALARAVENVKLPWRPFVITENSSFCALHVFSTAYCLTTTVEVQSTSSVIQSLLMACTLLLYHLQRECSGPVHACMCMTWRPMLLHLVICCLLLPTVTSQYHLGFKVMVAKQQKARMVAVDNQGIMFTVA